MWYYWVPGLIFGLFLEWLFAYKLLKKWRKTHMVGIKFNGYNQD